MIVLGIDPGLRLTGYAAVELPPPASGQRPPALLEAGVFRLSPRLCVADRLVELDRDLRETLARLRPAAVAVEKLYAHYKHPTTAITMAHARGVIFLAIRSAPSADGGAAEPIPLIELASTEVKKSLTGNGHASKRQMQSAVQHQLRLTTRPEPPDVADAIAIALCAARRAGRPSLNAEFAEVRAKIAEKTSPKRKRGAARPT